MPDMHIATVEQLGVDGVKLVVSAPKLWLMLVFTVSCRQSILLYADGFVCAASDGITRVYYQRGKSAKASFISVSSFIV